MSGASALVHFSGGADSTLSAALFAERFDHVHLVTYDRFSFLGAKDYADINYRRLRRVYGEARFTRVILPMGAWHKTICYERYAYFVRQYGLAVAALAFCKLAMHWRSALYCLEKGIATVGDGAVPYMDMYPDQNRRICLEGLSRYYAAFGIRYENPVFAIAGDVEQTLYDKGITDLPRTRGTDADRQVFYVEQVLLALFVKYYQGTHGRAKYEAVLSGLFSEKMEFMSRAVRQEWNPRLRA